jgi:valacyclovir hydrolase
MPWSEDSVYYEVEGNGDPVLLIPGWGGSIEELLPIRRALAPRYRVIAADPPGSGRSKPQPREYTTSYLEDDSRSLLGLLHTLRASPAHVVGFSDGGEYALLMAELEPSEIRSLVTWGAAGHLALPPGMLEAWTRVVDDPIPPLQGFSNYLKTTYGASNARIMIQSHARTLGRIVEAGGDISRRRAGEISCPALLITGEQDFLAPPSLVSDMAAAMQRAEFREVQGVGHNVHQAKPDWLATTIVEWLAAR